MCDYSLMNLPNRLANEGEDLIVHRFSSGSLGLASPADVSPAIQAKSEPRSFWAAVKNFFSPVESCPVPAVCIPPGARLRLTDLNERMRRQYKLNPEEEVTFTQLTAAANTYRDAVVFSSGVKLKLQELSEGQRVTVLELTLADVEEPTLTSPVRLTSVF